LTLITEAFILKAWLSVTKINQPDAYRQADRRANGDPKGVNTMLPRNTSVVSSLIADSSPPFSLPLTPINPQIHQVIEDICLVLVEQGPEVQALFEQRNPSLMFDLPDTNIPLE
jgi:hypothetical protein